MTTTSSPPPCASWSTSTGSTPATIDGHRAGRAGHPGRRARRGRRRHRRPPTGRACATSRSRRSAGRSAATSPPRSPPRPTRWWSSRSTTPGSTRSRSAPGSSYLPFIARAVDRRPRRVPARQRPRHAEGLVVHDGVHLGIAVDVDFEGAGRAGRCATPTACASPPSPRRSPTDGRAGPGPHPGGRRLRRRHLHPHQRRPLRHPAHRADHQPAPGRDPVDRRRQGPARRRPPRRRRPRPRRPPGRATWPVASTTGPSTAPTPSAFLARVRDLLEQRDWEAEAR